jgi:hypothetical protein
MLHALKTVVAGIVALSALALVPVTCVIVLAMMPDRALHKTRDIGVHPAHIENMARRLSEPS